MASPTFIGAGATTPISNSGSVPRPAVSSGDLMIMFVQLLVSTGTITFPSGWTTFQNIDPNSPFRSEYIAAYKIAGGSEPSTYTVSGTYVSDNRSYVTIAAWSGVDTTSPINISASSTVDISSTSVVCPSVTTTVADTTIVCFYGDRGDQAGYTHTAPSGMTARISASTAPFSHQVADKAVSAVGATGTQTATSSSSHPYMAMTFAIAGPVVTSIPCTKGDATATGLTASIFSTLIISGLVGNATASGSSATIGNAINCTVASVVASGVTATILSATTISCTVSGTTAAGLVATLTNLITSDIFTNNTDSVLASTAVSYSWIPAGRFGSLSGLSATDYTGTTDSNGRLVTTINHLTSGAGILLISKRNASALTDDVAYEAFA